MTFSQKLKYILSEQNISQAELSRLTGINKSSICQYLSGKNIPSKKRQGVIATAIGMPEDYFGNENFKEPSISYPKIPRLTLTETAGIMGVSQRALALAIQQGMYTLTQKKSTTEADKFAQSCKKLKKEQDEVASSIRSMHKDNAKNVNDVKTQGVQADNLLSKLKSLIGVQEKDAGTKQQIKSTVQQLNDILPDLNLQYDEQKDKLNQSTAAIKRNIQALKEQAMAKAYQSGMESAAEKVAEAEVANQNATEKYTEALEKKNAAQEKFDKLEKEKGLGSGNKELAKAAEDLMKYEKSLQTTEKALDKSEKNLNAANKELTTYSDKFTTQTNYSDFLSNLDKLAKDAGIKAKKIPETVLENIKAGNYKKLQLRVTV